MSLPVKRMWYPPEILISSDGNLLNLGPPLPAEYFRSHWQADIVNVWGQ